MSKFILTFIIFSNLCFAEQKFKPNEDENNYTKKVNVEYLKNLLATDPGFRVVYMKAKDCIKKRDFKCLFDSRNENKLEDDKNWGYDNRNLEILERKLNCKQYDQLTAFVVNATPEQSKRHEQSKKCAAEVAKAYAAHDLTPPWDLFDTAVSESKKVKLLVRVKEGKIIIIISVFDPVLKSVEEVLQFSQMQNYKELIWYSDLIYSGPKG